jgi:hypothetical protein
MLPVMCSILINFVIVNFTNILLFALVLILLTCDVLCSPYEECSVVIVIIIVIACYLSICYFLFVLTCHIDMDISI